MGKAHPLQGIEMVAGAGEYVTLSRMMSLKPEDSLMGSELASVLVAFQEAELCLEGASPQELQKLKEENDDGGKGSVQSCFGRGRNMQKLYFYMFVLRFLQTCCKNIVFAMHLAFDIHKAKIS